MKVIKWLGSAFQKAGDIDNAIESYQTARHLAPSDSRPHVALGLCFTERGLFDEAIKMLKRGLDLKPYCTEADVRLFLADALLKNGSINEACDEWRRVLEIEPGWPSDDEPQKEARELLAKYETA